MGGVSSRAAHWPTLAVALAVLIAGTATAVMRAGDPFATLKVLGTQISLGPEEVKKLSVGRSGDELSVGDYLRTDPTGFGQVDYFEGSLTRLDKDTEFTVRKLTRGEREIRVRLEVGQTWNRVRRLTGLEGRFEVETPNAVAAVRGTRFAVHCDRAKTCTLTVVDGRLHVSTSKGEAYDLGANQRLVVGPDGAAVRPPPPPLQPRKRGQPPPTPAPPPDPVRTLPVQEVRSGPWIALNLALDAGSPAPTPAPGALSNFAPAPAPPAAPTPKPKPTVAAPAAGTPSSGRIVFGRGHAIWTMNPDGSALTQLIAGMGAVSPKWSADRARIAFSGYRAPEGELRRDIFVMGADGSGLTNVTNTLEDQESGPAWAPDGRRLSFSVTEGSAPGPYRGLYIIQTDGKGRTLVPGPADSDSAWSPDGRRIAAVSGDAVYVMNPDGSGATKIGIPDAYYAEDPDFSPDGRRLVFDANIRGLAGGDPVIVVSDVDGSGMRIIDTGPEGGRNPAWSPDGTKIVFEKGSYIWVMNADGSSRARIFAEGPGDEPDW